MALEVISHDVGSYLLKGHSPAFNLECRERLAIWTAICSKDVILALFFDKNVYGQAYLRMLNEFAFPGETSY